MDFIYYFKGKHILSDLYVSSLPQSIPSPVEKVAALRRFARLMRENISSIQYAMGQYLEWSDELDPAFAKSKAGIKAEIEAFPASMEEIFGALDKIGQGIKSVSTKHIASIPIVSVQLHRIYERMLLVQANAAAATPGSQGHEFPAQTYALGLRKLKLLADALGAISNTPSATHTNALVSCAMEVNAGNKSGFKPIDSVPARAFRAKLRDIVKKHPSLGRVHYDARFPFLSEELLAR